MPRTRLLAWLAATVLISGCESPSDPRAGNPAEVQIVAGDLQDDAVVGAQAPGALVARVLDGRGKAVAGTGVVFVVTAGSGTVTSASAQTDAHGLAQARWELGTAAGDTQRVEVRTLVPAGGDGHATAEFRAVARPAAPHSVAVVGEASRTGTAGAALADSLAARVTDQYGNGVPGVAVVWRVSAGGGGISPVQSATDARGVAHAQWVLGVRVDSTHVAEASISPAVWATFRAVAGLPIGSALRRESGNAQDGAVGGRLPTPLSVRLVLPDGRPVQGATISWMVLPGAGSLAPPVSTTDADGRAETVWTLGTAAGTQVITANTGTISEWFTATAAPGPASGVALVGGAGQTGVLGAALPAPVAARVTDAHGNPVPGAQVHFSVVRGGGSAARATTDDTGVARTAWVLGTRADVEHLLVASLPGLPGDTLSATAVLPASAVLIVADGNGQVGTAGAKLASPVAVRLRLQDGRAVQGAAVSWMIGSGGGSIAPLGSQTDDEGRAETVWTLGTRSGPQEVRARVAGLSQSLTATAGPGTAVQAVVVEGDAQTGAVGGVLPAPVGVRVSDAHGNPVPGAAVQFSVVQGGGSATPAETGADGVARSTWTLGTRADVGHLLAASVAGGPADTARATPVVPATAILSVAGGNGQQGATDQPLADSLRVRLLLADGRPVVGAAVLWASGDGGPLSPTPGKTSGTGSAASRWTLGGRSGGQQATASVPGVWTATFHATAAATSAASLEIVSGNAQADTVMTTLQPLVVRALDRFGGPAAGLPVQWAISAGGGTLVVAQATTRADGLAFAQWTLPTSAGGHSVTASVSGAPAVAFTATAGPGRPQLARVGGDTQTGTVGTQLAGPLAARVADRFGNPYPGVTVTFSGSGLNPASAATDHLGVARSRWTLPTTAGSVEAVASHSGMSVTFRATAVAGPAASLAAVSAVSASLVVGTQRTLTVRALDSYGNATSRGTVQWRRVSGPGTVTPAQGELGSSGQANAQVSSTTAGTEVVDAALASGSPAVRFSTTWTAGSAYRAELKPDTSASVVGSEVGFAIYLRDTYGNAATGGVGRSYRSLDPAVRCETRLFDYYGCYGSAVGTARIVTTSSTLRNDTVLVIVRPSPQPPVATVAVRPDTGKFTAGQAVTLYVGQDVLLRGQARDVGGDLLAGSFTFATSNSAAGAIERLDGFRQIVVIRGKAPGTTQVTATSGGITGSVTIQVIPAP